MGEYVFSVIIGKLFKYVRNLPKDNQLVFKLISVEETSFIDEGSRLFKMKTQLYIRGEGDELIEGYDVPIIFYVRVGVYHDGTVEDIKKYYETSIRINADITDVKGIKIVGDKVENIQAQDTIVEKVKASITIEELLKGAGGFTTISNKPSEPSLTYKIDVTGVTVEDRPLGNAVVGLVVNLKKPMVSSKDMKVERNLLIKIPYYNKQNVEVFIKVLEEYIKYLCKNVPGYVKANDTILVREYDGGILHNHLKVFSNHEELPRIKERVELLNNIKIDNVNNIKIECHDEKYQYILGGNGFIINLEDFSLVYIKGETDREDTYRRLNNENVLNLLKVYDYRTNVVKNAI